ncbi:MAG: UvrD-helicase domain-containing protein [Bacteroides sp.]|nr:UvrD-helicase domain-containing protein [Bacteroides sp.]
MELTVYKASAGSGKTFTLTVEYIKLLIRNPKAYQHILAVTFTNKATEEMKSRILSQLYGIWTGDPASGSYLSQVRAGTSWTDEYIKEQSRQALLNMLHDYDHFRVETIDSFFQSVMRNLARELELSPNLHIELNNVEVLNEAVNRMLEKLTFSSPVLGWLLDYIQEQIDADRHWNISEEIKQFGRNILNEEYLERGEELRRKLKVSGTIPMYRKALKEMQESALDQMREYSRSFTTILAEHSLTGNDLKNGSRGIGSYFRKLSEGDLKEKIRNTTVEKCLTDETQWATKTSAHYEQILALARSQLMPLLEEAETHRRQNNMIVNSCALSLKHLNKLQLLAHIDEELRLLNRENNRFLLSDTTALLHKLIGEGDSSFVFEKTGSALRHIMIDEFQDTSRMQWSNFRLLLLEGLSQGSRSLIVGDIKQSIYRWRNGDWGILNSLTGDNPAFPYQIRIKTLQQNYRSEARIIQFNNSIFNAGVEFLNQLHRNHLGKNCEELTNAYADVVQKPVKETEKGYIKVSFVQPDEERNYTQETLRQLGEEVQRLIAKGVAEKDIAILVRKNKNIPYIADYFYKNFGYKVVSDEAFRLDASPAVCMLIDALRYLSDPENKLVLSQLILNYQRTIKKADTTLHELLFQCDTNMLPAGFSEKADRIRMLPIYEMLEELYLIFHMERMEGQDAYLFTFFDHVIQYVQKHFSGTDTFIKHWEEKLRGQTIPGDSIEGIRILSIHKSKGLEFHTVLLPFCDWKLENETNNQLVWCAPQESPYNQLDLIPINYSSSMAESIYHPEYRKERLQLWVDNLNLLYVAFTRAEKNLIVWARKEQRNTVSELLANALMQVSAADKKEWNIENPYEEGEVCLSEAKPEKFTTNKFTQQANALSSRMHSNRPNIRFRQSNRSADFISDKPAPHPFLDRKRILHTLLCSIHTLQEADPAIRQMEEEGILGNEHPVEEIRDLLHRSLTLPEAKEWYTKEWKLFNECTILYKEQGKSHSQRPDRVMTREGEAVVVDFRFGEQEENDRTNIETYVELLVRMGYQHIAGYVWYVDNQQIEKIKEMNR